MCLVFRNLFLVFLQFRLALTLTVTLRGQNIPSSDFFFDVFLKNLPYISMLEVILTKFLKNVDGNIFYKIKQRIDLSTNMIY